MCSRHFSNFTMVPLHDLGGRIAPLKSKIFATVSDHRRWLQTYIWPALNTNITMVQHMRDLGAFLNTTLVSNTSLSRKRLHDATQILLRIAHLPFAMAQKIKFARSCAHTRGLYGCEVSHVDESALRHYTSVLLGVIGTHNTMHARSLIFAFSGAPPTIDPYIEIFSRRLLTLRRIWIKMPSARHTITQLYQHYCNKGALGAACPNVDVDCLPPAPLPGGER